MARKIKFALEMANGVKVRSNLEELRENFDIDKAVGHFLSGKLVEWLEDRYYEDEAEKISVLDKDSPDFRQKFCDVLGVEYEGSEETGVEFLERLNEKKNYLRQKTDDKSIVANADKTALNQEDLSDLLDMEEPTIYLCGESFNIPIRVEKKKYIGILGTPKISIKANSQAELDAKNISFENCILPFAVETVAKVSVEKSATKVLHIKYTPYIPRKRLLKIAITIGRSRSLYNVSEVWNFDFSDEKVQKKIALQKIFGGEYSEEDLVYVSLEKDYSTKIPGFKSGWGLTIDSFCHGSLDGTCEIIKFEDVKQFYEVNSDSSFSTSYELMIETKDGQKHDCKECNSRITSYGDVEFMKDFLKEIAETRKYLEMAGELEEKKFEDLVSLDELKEIFKNVFGYDTESSLFEVYNLMDRQDEDELTEEKKKIS